MAKGKKKENLTPEERLQAALVSEKEQPYKVPKNWCWTRIANLCSLSNGKAFKSTEWSKTGIPIVRIQNLNNPEAEYNLYSGVVENKFRLCGGELLFAWSGTPGSSFGAHIWWGKEAVLNQHIFRIDFDEKYINKIFFKYAINQQLNMLISVAHGGAGLQHVTKSVFEATPIPLPPLSEQQRIVDRIESLFSKLDEAKQKAQNALDSFETRKAVILHKAFTGELTAQWRKEHGIGRGSWEKKRFGEVATIKSNLVDPTGFPNFPHIAPDNIEKKTGILLEYHTISEDGVTSGKHRFYPGQILYSKIRPYLSKVIVVDFDGLCSADMYPIEAKGNTKCLWYYMLSEEFVEQASSAGSRSVLPKINQKELSSLTVNLPTVNDEQEEIVRILDDMFAKEQQAKEIVEAVLEQIDLIKKSIFARAFRGELGTNDPREESSVELLKRSFLEIMKNEEVTPKRVIKPKAKEIFMSKTITEVLLKDVRLTPEQLKSETKLSIDDFYAQLKELIDNGKIVENRENGESYLEVANENRQIENHQL